MRKLLFSLILAAAAALAQTAAYPGAVVTDNQLRVAVNNVQTTLTFPMLAGDTAINVANATGIVTNSMVTIDNEKIAVCNVVGNQLTVGYSACPNVDGRGFDQPHGGGAAVAHANGAGVYLNIDAWFPNAVRVEMEAIENALGANLANVLVPNPLPVNKGGTGAATAAAGLANLLAGSKQGNGTNVQMAGTNSGVAGAPLCDDANGNAGTSGCTPPFPSGAQTQVLQIQPNTGNNTTYQFAPKPQASAADYNFPAQQPGGSLIVGSNTSTLSPCPLGVNGTDSAHYLYVSGGVGTPEAVLITGGTCTSGASSGTVIFTAANTHSGAWTIASVMGGVPEAAVAAPGATLYVASSITAYGMLALPAATTLQCAPGATITQAFSGTALVSVPNSYGTIQGCTLNGNQASGGASSTGVVYASGSYFSLLNSVVENGSADGVHVTADHAALVGNRVTGNLYTGISVIGTPSAVAYARIVGNFVSSVGETHLYGGPIGVWGSHALIDANTVQIGGNQDAGISCLNNPGAGMVDCSITGNTIEVAGANAFEGIGVGSVNGFSVSGNTIVTSTAPNNAANLYAGIEINQCTNGTVSGNSFDAGNATAQVIGVYLESSSQVAVTGNSIQHYGNTSGTAGMFIELTSATLALSNNVVSGNTLTQSLSTATVPDIKMDTLAAGTAFNDAILGNIINGGSTTTGHVCVQISNSGAATSTGHVIKGNSITGCDTGINDAVTSSSIEDNTIAGSNTLIAAPNGLPRLIDRNGGTATASSGAATLNRAVGTITSESLTTAAGSTYTLTLTDSLISASSTILANVFLGSATTGTPQIVSATPGAGSAVIVVKNIHASAAFNGTIKVQYQVQTN